jgi:hypothetical protein
LIFWDADFQAGQNVAPRSHLCVLFKIYIFFHLLEAEKLLLDLETEQFNDIKAKNLDKMVSHYHPDATLVHKGVKAFYGHDRLLNSSFVYLFHF